MNLLDVIAQLESLPADEQTARLDALRLDHDQRSTVIRALGRTDSTDLDGDGGDKLLGSLPAMSMDCSGEHPSRQRLGSAGLVAGKYRLLEPLGRGTFGEVWKAVHRGLDSPQVVPTCLKLLYPDVSGVLDVLAEARTIASIRHENVVSVRDVGTLDLPSGPVGFIEMELVGEVSRDGEFVGARPLSRVGATADDKPVFSFRDAARIAVGICRGIEAAHRRGTIHRDLKPDNVLVEPSTLRAKIIDFGIASAIRPDDRRTAFFGSRSVLGTPAFMAPEQLSGEATTLSDVYSLGGILAFLLTGENPYSPRATATGPDRAVDVLRQLAEAVPPHSIRTLRPDVPRVLDAIAVRAMARDPDARYPSAKAMADDLQAYLDYRPTVALPRRWPVRLAMSIHRNPMRTALATACVAVVAIGLTAWQQKQSAITRLETERRERAEHERTVALEQRRVAESTLADRMVAEADAKAAEWRWADARSLLEQAAPLLRDEGRNVIGVDMRLWQSYRLAPPPLVTLPRAKTVSVALSGDGRRAATGHTDGSIAIWNVLTGQTTGTLALIKLPLPVRLLKIEPWTIRSMSMSRDGRLLLAGGKDLRLTLWDLDKQTVRHQLGGHQNQINCVAMSLDGTLAISGGWSSETHAWDLTTGEQIWVKPFRKPAAGETVALAFTADNQFAAAAFRGSQGLVLYGARTGEEVKSFRGPNFDSLSCLAADPTNPDRLAVGDDQGGVRVISISEDATRAVLAGHRNRTARLAFTPDGSQLISSGDDGLVRVWDLATSRQVAALPGATERSQDLAVSGDGRVIAVAKPTVTEIRVLNPASAADVTVPNFAGPHVWRACCISGSGRMGAIAGGGGIQVFDTATGHPLLNCAFKFVRSTFAPQFIVTPRFTADETMLVWGDERCVATLNLATGCTSEVKTQNRGTLVGIDPPAARIALHNGEDIDIVDRQGLSLIRRLAGAGAGNVMRVDFSIDGRIAVVATDATRREQFVIGSNWVDSSAILLTRWDLTTGRKLDSVSADGAGAESLATLPGGTRILMSSETNPAAVWDAAQHCRRFVLHPNGGGVNACQLTHAGRAIATVGILDRTLRLWDVDSGEPLAEADLPDLRRAMSLAVTSDGRWMIAAGIGAKNSVHGVVRDLARHRTIGDLYTRLTRARQQQFSPAAGTKQPAAVDASLNKVVGEWYASQGMNDWAVDTLASSAASEALPRRPSLLLARAYWHCGSSTEAAAEFDRLAANADPSERVYLQRCAQAVRTPVR